MQNRKLLPILLPLIFISLLTGIWAGWIRIGWDFPFPVSMVAGRHGALMVGSFLGTLISLERVVVLKNRWAFVVPLLSGCSIIFFVLQMDTYAFIALTLGSIGQAAIMAYSLERFKENYMAVMLAGSLCWVVGNLMWLTYNLYPLAVPWWMAFLLLIITGERLELTRFLPIKKKSRIALLGILGVFLVGIIMPFHGNGRYLAGAGLILTGLWLLKYDMATKSVKKEGQHRFSAISLLMGYGWLVVSGTLILSDDLYGFLYDAVLHTFFVGFVFSMIFAHGPVILPGVLGVVAKPYHRSLFLWVVLLQGSLIVRILADLFSLPDLRMWGGLVNGVAILGFFVFLGILVFTGNRRLDQL